MARATRAQERQAVTVGSEPATGADPGPVGEHPENQEVHCNIEVEENVDYDEESSHTSDVDMNPCNAPSADPAVAAPNQQAPRFALCPAQININKPLDYTKQADVKLYKAATEPFNKDKPYDIESMGLMQFMMEVHHHVNEQGWMDLMHGVCMITVPEGNTTQRYD